jgi:hypothetical protein
MAALGATTGKNFPFQAIETIAYPAAKINL